MRPVPKLLPACPPCVCLGKAVFPCISWRHLRSSAGYPRQCGRWRFTCHAPVAARLPQRAPGSVEARGGCRPAQPRPRAAITGRHLISETVASRPGLWRSTWARSRSIRVRSPPRAGQALARLLVACLSLFRGNVTCSSPCKDRWCGPQRVPTALSFGGACASRPYCIAPFPPCRRVPGPSHSYGPAPRRPDCSAFQNSAARAETCAPARAVLAACAVLALRPRGLDLSRAARPRAPPPRASRARSQLCAAGRPSVCPQASPTPPSQRLLVHLRSVVDIR